MNKTLRVPTMPGIPYEPAKKLKRALATHATTVAKHNDALDLNERGVANLASGKFTSDAHFTVRDIYGPEKFDLLISAEELLEASVSLCDQIEADRVDVAMAIADKALADAENEVRSALIKIGYDSPAAPMVASHPRVRQARENLQSVQAYDVTPNRRQFVERLAAVKKEIETAKAKALAV